MIRLLVVTVLAAQWLGGTERNTREGREHFEAGRLEEALRAFSRARAENPDAPATDLNLAGVHYRMGEAGAAGPGVPSAPPPGEGAEGGPLAEAARGYQAAISAGVEGSTARDAWFNLGNTLYRAGAFEEAAAAYAEALAMDPEDIEARQNFERAARQAEEANEEQSGDSNEDDGGEESGEQPPPEQQQEQDQNQPSPDDEQDSQQPQGQEPQPQQQDPGDGEDQQQPPESQPEGDQSEGDRPDEPEPPEPPPPEGDASGADVPPDGPPGEVPEVSPEQAERILAALAEVERAFQQEQVEKRRARALRRGRH